MRIVGGVVVGLWLTGIVMGCDKKPDAPADRPPPHVPSPPDPGRGEDAPPPAGSVDPDGDRIALVPENSAHFGRVEGDGFPNACNADRDCYAGGCSGEVCSAERGAISDCSLVEIAGWPTDAACGCVAGDCRWFSPSAATLPATKPATKPDVPPRDPDDCGGTTCKAPQACVRYFGIAGARGPEFASCEIRCKPGGTTCPAPTTCVTIADGPGSVCR